MALFMVSDVPTIIFGADVTHPHPGEDSSPSIAAVVASQDWPEITKYAGLVCAQAHRQELIQDMFKEWQDPNRGKVSGGMIKELLISFHRATGQKPQRIIFYRDGVSEGQFYQVLLMSSMRSASTTGILCTSSCFPGTVLHGAGYIRQWIHDQWCYWSWRWW